MFFKERKPDTVKPFDTTKEGNWSKCLSVMCHLLWSVSQSSLISGVPVCIGAISCTIVHSCLTHQAWETAVSPPPTQAGTGVIRTLSVSVAGRGLFCRACIFLNWLPAQLRENYRSVQRFGFKMNWQSLEKEDMKEGEIHFKVKNFIIRILKPRDFLCSLLLGLIPGLAASNYMVAYYKCETSDPT